MSVKVIFSITFQSSFSKGTNPQVVSNRTCTQISCSWASLLYIERNAWASLTLQRVDTHNHIHHKFEMWVFGSNASKTPMCAKSQPTKCQTIIESLSRPPYRWLEACPQHVHRRGCRHNQCSSDLVSCAEPLVLILSSTVSCLKLYFPMDGWIWDKCHNCTAQCSLGVLKQSFHHKALQWPLQLHWGHVGIPGNRRTRSLTSM